MTFANFERLFKSKYPTGEVYPHDDFEHGTPGRRQKVAVTFTAGGKVYKYAGAYEAILNKCGVPVVSKERLSEMEARLARLKKQHGTPTLFDGLSFDWSAEIAETEKQIAEYRANYTIV